MSRPFRYTFILVLVALGATLAAVGGWRYARASAPVPGPIILISIDTLRADHLPAYGYAHGRTPAIDALARDGVMFERAYAHAPQTLPAHAALLSGRLPFETGVRDEVGTPVKRGERLLPQMLRERGYATAGVVSTALLRRDSGIGQGFDFFDAEMPADAPDAPIESGRRDGAQSEAIVEHWLDSVASPRAFVFLQIDEPHAPYAPPDRFADLGPYDGEIAYADEIVGRLIRYLKSHQLYDQSTIALVSDHGEGLGDHGERDHGLLVYEESLRVPLIIKQAVSAGAGRRIDDPVQHLDLVPTILDLAKAPIPGNLRGRSLKPLLDGSGHPPAQPIYAEAEYAHRHFGWSAVTTITDGRHRYIASSTEELYDLKQDPGERENVADRETGTRKALRGALERIAGRPARAGDGDDAEPDAAAKVAAVETYRAALALASERRWTEAIAELQPVLRDNPTVVEFWRQVGAWAMLADRVDQAIDAYKRVIELRPADPDAYLAAADALAKARRFDDAREQAEQAAVAAGKDRRAEAAAHQALATIALARRDVEAARTEAEAAADADPTAATVPYVEARVLYDQANYEDALPLFEQAITAASHAHGVPIPELHFYAGDTLNRLDRQTEAEAELLEELREYPHNVRARAALVSIYQGAGRDEEATRELEMLTRITPTSDAYAAAARLWTAAGDHQQADAMRALAANKKGR